MPWKPQSICPRHKERKVRGRCQSCDRERPSPARRGYDRPHRAERERVAWDVEAGLANCARCGLPIGPGETWDLGHTEDRTGWTGPEHQRCNRATRRKE